MEPITASIIISAVLPFLKKGGEAIAGGVGRDLWELVKRPFQSESEKRTIEELEKSPDNTRLQGKVEGKLKDLLIENPDIAEEISALLPKAREEGKMIVIQNSKGVVLNSKIKAGGYVIIGGDKNG